jgi:regulator of RNase E activity RraA
VADPDFDRLTLSDVLDAVEASPQPAILVLQQKFSPELQGKVGLSGGVMTTALQAVGCAGVVSNGPSRDMDEIRPMGMPYLLSGVTPGHGQMSVRAVNVPVSVAGMDVAPGEIVHMDENGACKFPADKIEAVLTNVRELMKQEAVLMERLRKAKNAAAIRQIMESHTFTNPNKR